MRRSIRGYALGSVITFVIVVVIAATSVLVSLQHIAVESSHLTDGVIPWIEANQSYNVAMTSTLGSIQTYLVAYDADELDEAESTLHEVDASLQALAHIEQTEALTAHGGADQLPSIQQRRIHIRDATARILAIFHSDVPTQLSTSTIFDSIEDIEGELDALHADQQQLRQDSTQTAHLEIAGAFQQTVIVVLAVSAIILALISVLYVVVHRRIANPLVRLTQATDTVGAGDYAANLGQGGIAEVGQLQRGFQIMIGLLKEREAALTLQVDRLRQAHEQTQQAEQHLRTQLQTINDQRAVIREMSVPVLPVTEAMLVMPLVGTLDSERLDIMRSNALNHISRQRTEMLLLDVTGVPIIDSLVAQGLMAMVQTARLLGTRTALVGIRPEVAQTIVGLGLDFGDIRTYASLQEGIITFFQQWNDARHNRRF